MYVAKIKVFLSFVASLDEGNSFTFQHRNSDSSVVTASLEQLKTIICNYIKQIYRKFLNSNFVYFSLWRL